MQSQNLHAVRDLSALVDFSKLINSSLELNSILNNLILTCFGKFHTTKGFIILDNPNGGIEVNVIKGLPDSIKSELKSESLKNCKDESSFQEFLTKYNLPVCQEILTANGIIGYLVLGKKITGKEYDEKDLEFLKTISNLCATAIENSLIVERLKDTNKQLDGKVNQLSSLFDLSKEFSGLLEKELIGKMLVFSIIGQLMVSKFSVFTFDENDVQFLENRFATDELTKIILEKKNASFTKSLIGNDVKESFPELYDLGVDVVSPMQIKGETKGLILLGKRINSQPFTDSDAEYISSVGSLAIISIENSRLFKEAIEKQKLEKDLEIAKNIQRNLLPDKMPDLNSFSISAFNKTAKQVGGDYYDIIDMKENDTIVGIADVSGKGVQAALLMANFQAFLQSICKQNIPIDEASNLINDLVSDNTTLGSFITFFWGSFNDVTKELTYVNAGHNPPLLVRNGELIKLKKGGMILGVIATTIPYISETVQLQKDDLLVLFTDGITEAMNSAGEEYSDEKLEELSLELATKDSEEVLNSINNDVDKFTEGAEQSDDITLMVIKVK